MTTMAQRERGSGSAFQRMATALGKKLAKIPDEPTEELPEPMPARDGDGNRVWLHYRPLRWERHP